MPHLQGIKRFPRSCVFAHRMNCVGAVLRDPRSSLMSHVEPIVFVVDDDISVRESLEALINCEDWKAETFASAKEFLARPRVPGASCLILDVSLPDLNGLDLQTRLSVDRTNMPIIFITGHGDIPMTVRAMKAGAIELPVRQINGGKRTVLTNRNASR